jgi:hypothetical protein
MSEWFKCRTCSMAHPWRVPDEKPCPNEVIVKRTGLRGLAALKASGLFDKFDKPPAVDRLDVNTPVNTTGVNARREYMRKQRARASEAVP